MALPPSGALKFSDIYTEVTLGLTPSGVVTLKNLFTDVYQYINRNSSVGQTIHGLGVIGTGLTTSSFYSYDASYNIYWEYNINNNHPTDDFRITINMNYNGGLNSISLFSAVVNHSSGTSSGGYIDTTIFNNLNDITIDISARKSPPGATTATINVLVNNLDTTLYTTTGAAFPFSQTGIVDHSYIPFSVAIDIN
jgi:hypothetical protein